MLRPRSDGQAAWFPHGRVFGTVRKRLFFIPYQFKARRSRVFDIVTSGNDILFHGYECVFFF